MKDKIVRLSKGITEIETPVMEITPGSVFDTFVLGRDAGFIIELLSTNGISMKGICFADDPRITADAVSFVGRRVHVTFHISTSGIAPGYKMTGTVEFVTNGGEISIPYSFGFVENTSLTGQAGSDPAAFFIGTGEAPAFLSDDFVSENPLKVSYALTDRTNTAEDQTCDPEESILLENLP
ncbi:MAG: DUF5717 family protein, partial [Eubacteriales bacterium]|nr:DUF5717 family protein [Eubacteriales bacterium]